MPSDAVTRNVPESLPQASCRRATGAPFDSDASKRQWLDLEIRRSLPIFVSVEKQRSPLVAIEFSPPIVDQEIAPAMVAVPEVGAAVPVISKERSGSRFAGALCAAEAALPYQPANGC